MKHLERLGSIAFATVMLSFVFHVLAISFNHWKSNICFGCDQNDALASWYTTIRQRCYQSGMVAVFSKSDPTLLNLTTDPFITEICFPNQYLMAKGRANGLECLWSAINGSDTVCSIGNYNPDHCYCDYTISTKLVLGFSILASLALGIMIFLGHLLSFVKIDYVLKWLIPVSFGLLSLSVVCILIVLITVGLAIDEDVNELRYSWSLVESAVANASELAYWRDVLVGDSSSNYKVKLGWCFGLEILAGYFATVSLTIYAYVFHAKKQPKKPKK